MTSDVDAMRPDVVGSRHTDDEIRAHDQARLRRAGYLLDPHSAIAYLGLKTARAGRARRGVFLATAHPAKFREIVEPVLDRTIETPAPLAEALARPRHILRIEASLDAVSTCARCLKAVPYTYRQDVLDAVWRHGIMPTDAPTPELARGFVRDLYQVPKFAGCESAT